MFVFKQINRNMYFVLARQHNLTTSLGTYQREKK